MIPPPQLTETERAEMVADCIAQYRDGLIGPITFEANMLMLRVPVEAVQALKTLHRAECAKNRGERS